MYMKGGETMNKEEQIKYQNKYIAEKYDRFTATFPAGQKEVYRKYAESKGLSLNGYINKLISDDMNAGQAETTEQQWFVQYAVSD